MNYLEFIGFLQIVLIATTPVVFAGIGELVTEKSGVLNLGVEGMMLVGAVTAFVTLVITGSYLLVFFIFNFCRYIYVGSFCFFSTNFNVKSSGNRFVINNLWYWFKFNDWKEIYWDSH